MKILLVHPGQKLAAEANNPAVIDKERGKNPPLGILYVITTTRPSDLRLRSPASMQM